MLPHLGKGVFPPSPGRTHPARVAEASLVTTGLVSIQGCHNREGYLKVPAILPNANIDDASLKQKQLIFVCKLTVLSARRLEIL